MKNKQLALVVIFLTILCPTLFAQLNETKKKLTGSWIYAGLENKLEISEDDQKEQEKADRLNKRLIITFSATGRYQVWKKVKSKKEILTTGLVKLTKNGRHLSIDGLEGDIDTLTKDLLKLSSPDRPLMVFKRYGQ